jgi:hypothetical protein
MRVFVSYRRADSPQAVGRIYDKLVACYGADSVFKDVDSIPAGSDFRHVLEDSLATCDVLVAIIGGRWLTTAEGESRLNEPSDLVRLELETAIARGIRIIPLLVDGATIPDAYRLPGPLQGLASRNAIEIRPDPDFHRDISRLISAIGGPNDSGTAAVLEGAGSLLHLRYFLYVSRTKIEMLGAQMPITKPGASGPSDDIYQALGSVLAHLDRDKAIGSCEQPLGYFRGVLDMHFGDISFYRGGGRMVLFSGIASNGVLIGLVGSAAHVIGAPSMEPETLGYARPEFWLRIIESLTPPEPASFGKQMYDLDNMIDYQARRRADAPKQKVEFVAKRFLAQDGFLIGSPLFVAAAD